MNTTLEQSHTDIIINVAFIKSYRDHRNDSNNANENATHSLIL